MNGVASKISARILPYSAIAVGLCMSVFSIVKIASGGAMGGMVDSLLGSDSLLERHGLPLRPAAYSPSGGPGTVEAAARAAATACSGRHAAPSVHAAAKLSPPSAQRAAARVAS